MPERKWDRELGQMTITGRPPRGVAKWYEANSVEEIILITPHYWRDIEIRTGWWEVDERKYEKTLAGIRVPGGPARRIPIPDNYTGWLCIDIEQAYMQPFRFPHKHTDEEAVEAFVVFCEVINLTRLLRPKCKISLYNIVSGGDAKDFPFRWDLLRSMYALCDGIDIDVYKHFWLSAAASETAINRLRYDNAVRIAEELTIPLHLWTWHRQHGPDRVQHPEAEAKEWYDRWDHPEVTGFWMFWNETAPQWFREQQRELMS